jgi:hypothetical protein
VCGTRVCQGQVTANAADVGQCYIELESDELAL